MYLHTFGERENGSVFEEPFEGRNLSKLNLCEDGESRRAALRSLLHPGGTNPESSWGGTRGLGSPGEQLSNLSLRGQKHLAWLRIRGSQGSRAEEESLRLEGAAGGHVGVRALCPWRMRVAEQETSHLAELVWGKCPGKDGSLSLLACSIHPSARWAQPGHRRPLGMRRVSLGFSTARGCAPGKQLSLLNVDSFSSKLWLSCVCSCPEMPHSGAGGTGARWDRHFSWDLCLHRGLAELFSSPGGPSSGVCVALRPGSVPPGDFVPWNNPLQETEQGRKPRRFPSFPPGFFHEASAARTG